MPRPGDRAGYVIPARSRDGAAGGQFVRVWGARYGQDGRTLQTATELRGQFVDRIFTVIHTSKNGENQTFVVKKVRIFHEQLPEHVAGEQ